MLVVKFPARVNISAVIMSRGTASLVLYPPNTTTTAKTYLDTLQRVHIPAVRRLFPADDFTWIQVV